MSIILRFSDIRRLLYVVIISLTICRRRSDVCQRASFRAYWSSIIFLIPLLLHILGVSRRLKIQSYLNCTGSSRSKPVSPRSAGTVNKSFSNKKKFAIKPSRLYVSQVKDRARIRNTLYFQECSHKFLTDFLIIFFSTTQ